MQTSKMYCKIRLESQKTCWTIDKPEEELGFKGISFFRFISSLD